MGDALLAFFGAPIVHEDDPLRAVQAARDLLAAARAYSSEVEPRIGRAFELRVGINTGWVVLGDVGTDLKFEYTAMGDTVNVAARLQAVAQPMTALLTADTHHHVTGRVACRDRGIVAIRGRSQPVRAFELGPAASEPHAPAARQRTPAEALVGRCAELDELSGHLKALAAGQGGLLHVVGEAGIGKTRLLAEVRQRHYPTDCTLGPGSGAAAAARPPARLRCVHVHRRSSGDRRPGRRAASRAPHPGQWSACSTEQVVLRPG